VYWEKCEAYEALVDACKTIEIAAAAQDCEAWLLSLENEWHSCRAQHFGSGIHFSNVAHGIHAGMSGSPAINSEGMAIGVVCTGAAYGNSVPTEGSFNPNLTLHLPGWVTRRPG
jgi:hypothetical protein